MGGAPLGCLLALLRLRSGPAGAGRPTRVQRASCPSCPPALEGAHFCRESPRGFHIWRLCLQRVPGRAVGGGGERLCPCRQSRTFSGTSVRLRCCVCGGAGGAHTYPRPQPSRVQVKICKTQVGLQASPTCPGAGPRLHSSSSRPGTPGRANAARGAHPGLGEPSRAAGL